MKTKILVLSVIFTATVFNKLYSQITFPDEQVVQKWEYVTWYFWGGQCEKRIMKNGNIKNICEGQYVEIFDCDHNEQNCTLIGYYRLKGDSVLTRKNGYWNGQSHVDSVDCSKPFGLTYDFGADIGEELECVITTTNKEFWITDIQTIEYEEIPRTTRFVNFRPYINAPNIVYNMKWIDGIGSNIHPFYSLSCIGDHCEMEEQLTRVFRNDELIYQNTILDFSFPCTDWVTSTGNEINQNPILTILPNPAENFITIKTEGNSQISVKLNVYDVKGRKLKNLNDYVFGDPLNIENLSAGVYIIQVFDEKQIQNLKFVKK